MAVHVNLNGYTGVGKTSVSRILAAKYRTQWIPRFTTRPRRRGEDNAEYEFISEEEFRHLMRSVATGTDVVISDRPHEKIVFSRKKPTIAFGDEGRDILLFTVRQVMVRGEYYWRGVLNPRLWPEVAPDTELVLSTFGYKSPEIKQYVAPDMITVFIDVSDKKELRRRLADRCKKKNQNFTEMWNQNLKYMTMELGKQHQYVVYNDGTPEECAAEIEKLVGLSPTE